MEKEIKYKFPYWGPLVLEIKVDDDLIKILLEKGNESRKKNLDLRSKLAGHIDYEYYYEDYEKWFLPKFSKYVNCYLGEALDYFHDPFHFLDVDIGKKIALDWTLDSLWINYQRQNEYNPPHNHTGHISFVIYLQVPKEIARENELMEGVHNSEGPGTIVFNYGEKLPFNISSNSKFPKTGDLFIFPGWLSHYVYAFKSKVERISVSGNIKVLPTLTLNYPEDV